MVLSTALVSPDELGGLNYDKTFQHMFMRKLTRRVFGTHKQSTFGWRLITIATVLVASNYLISYLGDALSLLRVPIFYCNFGNGTIVELTLKQADDLPPGFEVNTSSCGVDLDRAQSTDVLRKWLTDEISNWTSFMLVMLFLVVPRLPGIVRTTFWLYVPVSLVFIFFTAFPIFNISVANECAHAENTTIYEDNISDDKTACTAAVVLWWFFFGMFMLTLLIWFLTRKLWPWLVASRRLWLFHDATSFWRIKPAATDSSAEIHGVAPSHQSRAYAFTYYPWPCGQCLFSYEGGLDSERRPHGLGTWHDTSPCNPRVSNPPRRRCPSDDSTHDDVPLRVPCRSGRDVTRRLAPRPSSWALPRHRTAARLRLSFG